MIPISRDPKRRIRRIRRYVSEWGHRVIENWALANRREKLYARELAWLCDYALRITTDHGRATGRRRNQWTGGFARTFAGFGTVEKKDLETPCAG
jgi:hypothetical protein